MAAKPEASSDTRREKARYAVDQSALRILREDRHQSQAEVAKRLTIHTNTWSRKEKGEKKLTLDEFAELCAYWQISPERLISYLVRAT